MKQIEWKFVTPSAVALLAASVFCGCVTGPETPGPEPAPEPDALRHPELDPAPQPEQAATTPEPVAPVPAEPAAAKAVDPTEGKPGEWAPLFNGESLDGWVILEEGEFKPHGKVSAKDGMLFMDEGIPFTAISKTGKLPAEDYEIELSAMRRGEGMDIFCGILFPVGDDHITMVLGGWNDTVVGLSCINGTPAAYNETAKFMKFTNDRWYAVRVRVTHGKIEAWIDGNQVIDLERAGKKISPYPGLDCLAPLGFFTWNTSSTLRDIRIRRLPTP